MRAPVARRKSLSKMVCGCLLLAAAALAPVGRATSTVSTGLSPADVRWLQRASFGLDSATLDSYQQLGRQGWLNYELNDHHDSLPPTIATMIASYPAISTSPAQLWAQQIDARRQLKTMPSGAAKVAAKKKLFKHARELLQQAQEAELLHAIYGSNPLKEQMVWFWLNHFSVYGSKGSVRLFAANYEEDVIRPHALGKFRDLVLATLKSPAMLEFLDNAKNVKGRTNENYGRELMELQTLGVGAGYTQQDVQQLMAILTGAGIARQRSPRFEQHAFGRPGFVRDGLFQFNPRKHDFDNKVFLGHTIKGRGFQEIEQAVTLITRQPACAHFISYQLAEYFVADKPPAALVDAMAQTFQRTDGDIAAVLRTMFDSPALLASKKFKDPTQFLVSAMKLTYDGQPISDVRPLLIWLKQMGEPVYGRITPDGWPLNSARWTGSGQMAARFAVARAIGTGRNRLLTDGKVTTPQTRYQSAPIVASGVYRTAIKPYLSAATRTALDKAHSTQEWNTYLLSSPDFNYR